MDVDRSRKASRGLLLVLVWHVSTGGSYFVIYCSSYNPYMPAHKSHRFITVLHLSGIHTSSHHTHKHTHKQQTYLQDRVPQTPPGSRLAVCRRPSAENTRYCRTCYWSRTLGHSRCYTDQGRGNEECQKGLLYFLTTY